MKLSEINVGCNLGIQNAERIKALEGWQKRQNGELGDVRRGMEEIKQSINKINVELIGGRPSWAVSLLITALFSIATGLVVFLLTH